MRNVEKQSLSIMTFNGFVVSCRIIRLVVASALLLHSFQSAMASSGSASAPSASSSGRMDPWATPYVNPTTQDEVDEYNSAIDKSEAKALELERIQSQTLLAKMKMPGDIAIADKWHGLGDFSNQLIRKSMKDRDDKFVYDPDERVALAARAAQRKRIRTMNVGRASSASRHGTAAPGTPPCTPPPPSPTLQCPGQANNNE